jgi:subtilisin family serine protease
MILCTFSNISQLSQFISASGPDTTLSTSTELSVNIQLYQAAFAQESGGQLVQTDFTTCTYIIATPNINTLATTATLVDLAGIDGTLTIGDTNYFVVESQYGLALYNELDGLVDQASSKISTAVNSNPFSVTTFSDFPQDYQWGRLRLISRNRPFAESWSLADTNFTTVTNMVIMDTGINFNHSELQGIFTSTNLYSIPVANGSFEDDVNHGTKIASIIAGTNIGLQPYINLINCKIMTADHLPNPLDISNALDTVYNYFIQHPENPMIVNMSWTFPKNNYLNHKIQNMMDAGIGIVCAAGNYGMDVSLLTPAGIKDVITVAASDSDDVSAGFNNFSSSNLSLITNYGSNVDIFAPGVDVLVATSDNNYYEYVSGTSISSAYISGCMAAIMSLIPNTYYLDAKRILIEYATNGALLLDLDQFNYSQNLLPFFMPATNAISLTSSTYYLGYLTNQQPTITGNINMMMNISRYSAVANQTFNYNIVSNSTATQTILENCIVINSNGNFEVSRPSINWAPDESIKLFEFLISASEVSGTITFSSPNLIFFATNPDVTTSITSDLSSALENVNAQSFFATVAPLALK